MPNPQVALTHADQWGGATYRGMGSMSWLEVRRYKRGGGWYLFVNGHVLPDTYPTLKAALEYVASVA